MTPNNQGNGLKMSDAIRQTEAVAQIILLNGVGSAGKSSIAKALQSIASKPFLHVQMDGFLDMLPSKYADHTDSFTYQQTSVNGSPEVAIVEGQLGAQMLRGMRHAIQALAAQGLNLIIDDVLMGGGDPGIDEYQTLLSPFAFYKVGVFASLETLEMRERRRGDRLIGLARWQFDRVHSGMHYDLGVHTDQQSPAEIAEEIRRRFGL